MKRKMFGLAVAGGILTSALSVGVAFASTSDNIVFNNIPSYTIWSTLPYVSVPRAETVTWEFVQYPASGSGSPTMGYMLRDDNTGWQSGWQTSTGSNPTYDKYLYYSAPYAGNFEMSVYNENSYTVSGNGYLTASN